MTFSGTERRRQLITAGIGTALALLMGTVLVMGFRLATHMRADIASLQTASSLQAYPEQIAGELNSLRDRLEVRAYSGQSLADLQDTVRRFDQDLRRLKATNPDLPQLAQPLHLWRQYSPVLGPVVAFSGQPYMDSDTGSTLSREGKEHYAAVKQAQRFASENARPLQQQLTMLAASLQRAASDAAANLRTLLAAGVLAAVVLAAIAAWFQFTRGRHERAARAAQEQTRDILRTVREGFFLLDANYRIGAVWSDALTHMFNRKDFAGLSFEELLKDLVPAATLATATKYIKLLWGDRAHENLMKTINPLGQLEISADDGHGGKETRYLQFDFHRVSGPEGVRHVLCAVGDVTSSVLLARELQDSQESANAQLDMMLGMMHVDPLQLMSFLDTSETGLKLVNAIMKEPARTDADFRRKLTGMMRELHSIKGEASVLNLRSIASRVHVLEDMLAECRKKPELTGNDFLPMVLKLDDLIAHLRSVREMGSRLTTLRDSAPPARATADPDATATAATLPKAASATTRLVEDLSPALKSMAERLAHDHAKQFNLTLTGLGDVPPPYATTVRDCLIQMLRNAAVHGIETPEVRRSRTKNDVGTVRVDFHRAADGYELLFEDDGAGITPETLRDAAVLKQLITAQEAAAMDTRTSMALIFRPGFSTQDQVSMDAGRGVGMDVVARSVYAIGGKIGVSTHPGKFTRFRIVLPPAEGTNTAVA